VKHWLQPSPNHPSATAVRKAIAEFDGRLVTSNFIFDETLSLCLCRLGHAAAERVGTVLLDPDTIDRRDSVCMAGIFLLLAMTASNVWFFAEFWFFRT